MRPVLPDFARHAIALITGDNDISLYVDAAIVNGHRGNDSKCRGPGYRKFGSEAEPSPSYENLWFSGVSRMSRKSC
jgi:hypothetical protein